MSTFEREFYKACEDYLLANPTVGDARLYIVNAKLGVEAALKPDYPNVFIRVEHCDHRVTFIGDEDSENTFDAFFCDFTVAGGVITPSDKGRVLPE